MERAKRGNFFASVYPFTPREGRPWTRVYLATGWETRVFLFWCGHGCGGYPGLWHEARFDLCSPRPVTKPLWALFSFVYKG